MHVFLEVNTFPEKVDFLNGVRLWTCTEQDMSQPIRVIIASRGFLYQQEVARTDRPDDRGATVVLGGAELRVEARKPFVPRTAGKMVERVRHLEYRPNTSCRRGPLISNS